ncbi:S66 family peptidase [Steroidobacter cummioxidans]|uniref:S66 family peptidase n=1 Tax=Steroidobacter cummioxidans TaxID=1803913 RepID=UPI000E30E16F|nr:S66 peptidase family protein [Steroidobacter cummioxidans]
MTIPLQRAQRFTPGSRIGILSPAAATVHAFPGRTERAITNLQEAVNGRVHNRPNVKDKVGYRAMAPAQVAAQLHEMFANPDVKLVITSIGGFNSNEVLRFVDWDLLSRHPTLICGYSDATALLAALHARTGQVVLHGPALLPQWGDPQGPLPECKAHFLHAIGGSTQPRELRSPGFWIHPRLDWNDAKLSAHHAARHDATWSVIQHGFARGRLVGGNVETINMLIGTPYCPSFVDRIVFLEANGAEAFIPRFHRALVHLRDADVFTRAAGVMIGRCPDALPVEGVSLADVVMDVIGYRNIPIAIDIDLGHSEPMLTMPIGCLTTFDARGADARLVIEEAAAS